MQATADFDAILLALAHPIRRAALRLLASGKELCLCDLMARLDVAQSSMSRHMTTLKHAGLVSDRRDAQWVRYRKAALAADLDHAVATLLAHDSGRPTAGKTAAKTKVPA